jgi:hypothetical protein
MSSITSLLAENYAGIPKSEYLKRLEYAAQPTPQTTQPSATTGSTTANSAVKLDLSPEAQRMIEAQNNPQFDPQAVRNILEEFAQTSGISVNWDKSLGEQGNRAAKIGTASEIARYLFVNPEKVATLKPVLENAYEQVDQAVRMRGTKEEMEQLNRLQQNLSAMTYILDETLREKGYLPRNPSEQPSYLQSSVPDEVVQHRDYSQYLEHRFEERNLPLTEELKALLRPELKTYTDMFGQSKVRLQDDIGESIATQIIGLTKGVNNIYPELQKFRQHVGENSDAVERFQQRADDNYASEMKNLREAVISATQTFAKEGRLEQAQAALNPYLEEFGLQIG